MSEVLTHKKPIKHRLDKHIADVLITSPSDGQVLTYEAASLKWKNKEAPAGGTIGKGFKAYLGTAQSIAGDGRMYIVNLDTELFDDYGEFDTSTHKFTPQASGRYLIAAGLRWGGVASAYDGQLFLGQVVRTTSPYTILSDWSFLPRLITTRDFTVNSLTTADLIAGVPYALFAGQTSGVNQTLLAGPAYTWMSIIRLF
jgi:hypothetical protein